MSKTKMNTTEKSDFAKRLIELRKKKGYTQEKIAELICMDSKAYGKYERDLNKPPFETILALSEIYDVSCDYLLKGECPDYGRQFSEHIQKCPSDKQQFLLEIIKSYINAVC